MDGRVRFFVILMIFCLVSLNTASAYSAYIQIYIVDLDTNTDAEGDPIKLVDNGNSPIQWKIAGTGCTSPTGYTNNIGNGEYGDGDTIRTGSAATLTAGSACTLYLQVDEVKVGSYYYGSCTTPVATETACTTCAAGASTCPTGGWVGTPTNAYQKQAHNFPGSISQCNEDQDFGRCSDEIVTQLDDTATTEFSFSFTA